MTIKTESWKEQLEKVRAYGTFTEHKEESVEQSADEILSQEIEEELKLIESEEDTSVNEMSSGEMIKKLFKLRKDDEVNGVANLLSMTDVKVLQSMQKQNPKGFAKMAAHMGKMPALEEFKPVKESVEKTVLKLTEKNMLGRLAKQLQLNEQGKEQLFNYFERGELKQ